MDRVKKSNTATVSFVMDARTLPDMSKDIFHFLSPHAPIEPAVKEPAQRLMEEAYQYYEIQVGYRILDKTPVQINKKQIIVDDNISFDCGRVITSQLDDVAGLVVFTSSLGQRYDDWFKGMFKAGDPFEGYIADLIGSVTVEAATDLLEERIITELSTLGLSCTNRYSPGYCGWNVAEQKKLFSFLPDNFCGIELTESSLMTPIKSVSGIIGYGKSVRKKEYACKICTQENCYMSKMKAVG